MLSALRDGQTRKATKTDTYRLMRKQLNSQMEHLTKMVEMYGQWVGSNGFTPEIGKLLEYGGPTSVHSSTPFPLCWNNDIRTLAWLCTYADRKNYFPKSAFTGAKKGSALSKLPEENGLFVLPFEVSELYRVQAMMDGHFLAPQQKPRTLGLLETMEVNRVPEDTVKRLAAYVHNCFGMASSWSWTRIPQNVG